MGSAPLKLCLAAVSMALLLGAAQAAETAGWDYEFTPYVWAAGLDGSIRVNDRPSAGLAVEQGFSDILE